MTPAPVVAIDGPSGSGKGTISRLLAQRLGWNYLDSGAMYRILAHAALEKGVSLSDGKALAQLVAALNVDFRVADSDSASEDRVYLDGVDVSDTIRSESCGNAASQIAVLSEVRAALLQWQRDYARPPGLVADGRDMGSVVFPRAAVKIFLTASASERAERRYNQLKEKGLDVSLAAVVADIGARDERDRTRSVAPLQRAPGALEVDTTALSIQQVLEMLEGHVRVKLQV